MLSRYRRQRLLRHAEGADSFWHETAGDLYSVNQTATLELDAEAPSSLAPTSPSAAVDVRRSGRAGRGGARSPGDRDEPRRGSVRPPWRGLRPRLQGLARAGIRDRDGRAHAPVRRSRAPRLRRRCQPSPRCRVRIGPPDRRARVGRHRDDRLRHEREGARGRARTRCQGRRFADAARGRPECAAAVFR